MSILDSIKLPVELVELLLIKKLRTYAEFFDLIDKHDGWIPYPDSILDYFSKLGVTHWADLYSRDGIAQWIKDREPQLIEAHKTITAELGANPTPEAAVKFLSELAQGIGQAILTDEAIPGLEFLHKDIESIDVDNLSDQERQLQHDVWINDLVTFYNELALASHGESMFSLVSRANDSLDDDALVKAIQIDRSLLPYFKERLWKQSMKGNSNFFDSLAYRVNNPPAKGENSKPLLWILFKDLYALSGFPRSLTSKKILNIYQKAVEDYPKFTIDDELIVQRQKRKFLKMYRHPK